MLGDSLGVGLGARSEREPEPVYDYRTGRGELRFLGFHETILLVVEKGSTSREREKNDYSNINEGHG